MTNVIGIRRESVDGTERRTPLTPDQVSRIKREHDIKVVVQPSKLRVYSDDDYAQAGAVISDDLSGCNISLGVREIPIEHIQPGGVYAVFSHPRKVQRYDIPMLRHIIESGCTLLDYELVTNDVGKRLISFGDFAGHASMIDSLWILGKRLEHEGIANPFSMVKQATEYDALAEAEDAVSRVGEQIRTEGLPDEITPFVCAFTGRGHVSKGAQRIFNLLPAVEIRPYDLATLASSGAYSKNAVYRVEYRRPDLYQPFDPDAKYNPEQPDVRPESLEGTFHRSAEYATIIINGILWSPRYPRLLTREQLKESYERDPGFRLKVVADVTCEIEGSIELTVRVTTSEDPAFVFEPATGRVIDGYKGNGPVVLAVDRLPAELPHDVSESFGTALLPFVPDLARTDFSQPVEDLDIPEPFRKAIIAHRGLLTENFRYFNEYLL
jgi:alpha-aminoadipic semialdehyde synthase